MEISLFIKSLSSLISDKNKSKKTRISLLRLMIIECRNNQKLLEITSWQNISTEFQNEILKKLNSDSAKLYYSYVDYTLLGSLLDKIGPSIWVDSNEESNDVNKILSLITRIDAIKVIASLPLDLKNENRANMKKRLSNLSSINLLVIKDLENEIVNNG